MKNLNKILLFVLVFVGCVPQKQHTQIRSELERLQQTNAELTRKLQVSESQISISKKEKDSVVQQNSILLIFNSTLLEQNKTLSQNEQKNIKKKEYDDNGNLKSEIEINTQKTTDRTENSTKLEISDLRAENNTLVKIIENQKDTISTLRNYNEDLQNNLNSSLFENQKLQAETQRKTGANLWWLWLLIGGIATETIRFFLKKYKIFELILKLFIK
jgi:antitoxin component YwqK of YwqJK toxin-antitoxin module